ncbi:sensor histidine kinase, partial [Leucobacter soli]
MSIAPPPGHQPGPPAIPPAPVPTAAPRRRTSARAKSIWLVVLCAMLVISSGSIHSGETSVFSPPLRFYAGLGVAVMLGASVMLVWRHRWPVRISLGLIILTILIPTSPLPALLALPAAAADTLGFRRWGLIVGTFLATGVSFAWDVVARTSYIAMFVDEPAAGTPERIALFWAVPVLAAIAVTPFAATGIARRLRMERDTAQWETVAAERNVEALHREVELERHRQELARELHDTLAANLSTLSLHAGALEMTVDADDARAAAAARAVRESAQHSLDDLRHMVRELRNPDAPSGSRTEITEIPALIDEALRAGTDVRVQLFISDAMACDARVAHAAYRLVQESISNVRRHAPGAPLHLDLRGGPGFGLTLRTTNWLAPAGQPPVTVGGGNGLTGMAERVGLLG